jgi:hypothetical protein
MRTSGSLFERAAFFSIVAAAATMAACSTQSGVPATGTGASTAIRGAAIPSKAALRRAPRALCAPTSISYGPVLLNGATDAGAPQVLTVADVSTTETIVAATMTMIIGASGPASGSSDSGTTAVAFYDFGNKLVTTQYPLISGYPPITATGNAFTAYPSCNLSRVTFNYKYTWTITTPSLQTGNMSQTATITYPGQPTPTPAPSPSPTPTPTPAACAPMIADLNTMSARETGMETASAAVATNIDGGHRDEAINQLQAFVNRANDFQTAALAFDTTTNAAFPAYSWSDHKAISDAIAAVSNDLSEVQNNVFVPTSFWTFTEDAMASAISIMGSSNETRLHAENVYCLGR